ncbi:MAG: hypothetical protein AAB817_02625, partial [Patescibacteria group bacterium]
EGTFFSRDGGRMFLAAYDPAGHPYIVTPVGGEADRDFAATPTIGRGILLISLAEALRFCGHFIKLDASSSDPAGQSFEVHVSFGVSTNRMIQDQYVVAGTVTAIAMVDAEDWERTLEQTAAAFG